MANQVNIELNVDEKGAVTGVRNFDAATMKATASTAQLDAELKKVGVSSEAAAAAEKARMAAQNARVQAMLEGINRLKNAGKRTSPMDLFNEQVQGYTKGGMSGLAAQEQALANVEKMIAEQKLLKDAAGASGGAMRGAYGESRILMGGMMGSSRMMASGLANMASQAKGLAPLMEAAFPLLVAGAFVGIIAQVGVEVYNLYEKYLSLDAVAEKYNKEVQKAADQDFGNTSSLDTTIDRINQATAAVKKYRDAAEKMKQDNGAAIHAFDPAAPYLAYEAQQLMTKSYEWQRKLDALQKKRLPEQTHQHNLDEIDLEHAGDTVLRGQKKITAELQKQKEIIAENARFQQEMQGEYGNPVASSSLWTTGHLSSSDTKDLIAEKLAAAETAALRRQEATEIVHLQDRARQSELKGIALLEDQRKVAGSDWVREHGQNVAAIKAIDASYFAQEKTFLDNQREETEKVERQARLAGVTGIARIRMNGSNRVADIDASKTLTPENKQRQEVAARQETNAEILQSEQEFTDRIDELDASSIESRVKGIQRLRYETEQQIVALTKSYQKSYGTDVNAPDYQAHAGELNRGIGDYRSAEVLQENDYRKTAAEQTAAIEAQARAQSLSAERQQTAAIAAEYEARKQKYIQQLADDQISQDDFNRRMVAAGELRDAQLVRAAKQARDKMAGEFSRFFQNPMGSLKEMGDKVAGQMAASLVQRVQGRYATTGSTRQSMLDPSHWMGSIFGHVAGTRGAHPNLDHLAETKGGAAVSAANRTMRIDYAQIHVQSATLTGSGAAGASGMPVFTGGTAMARIGGSVANPAAAPGFAGGGGTGSIYSVHGAGGYDAMTGAGSVGGALMARIGGSVANPAAAQGFAGGGGTGSIYSVHGTGAYDAMTGAGSVGGALMARIGGSVANPAAAQGFAGGGGTGSIYSVHGTGAYDAMTGAGSVGGALMASGITGTAAGGAAAGGWGSSTSNFFTGSGPSPAKGPGFAGVMNSASNFAGMGKQALNLFSGKTTSNPDEIAETQSMTVPGSFDKNGNFTNTGATGPKSLLGGGGLAANASGMVSGGLGLYSAYEGKGGVGGAFSGALSGAKFGMAIGGPIGAGIGAAAGAVLGAIGFGGREQARVYDLKQVRPRLKNDMDSFQQGGMDYLSAYSDMQALEREANMTTNKMGPAAKSYYQDTIKGEIDQYEGKLNSEQRAGRSQFTAQAAQFAVGSDYIPGTGFAVLHSGERVVPSNQNERMTRALEAGASSESIARGYRAAMMGTGTRPGAGASSRSLTMNFHTLDSKTAARMFMENKHHIRAALNQSYAENSGGSDA